MSRKLSIEEKRQIERRARVVGDIILRGSRAFIAASRAPSRSENAQAEDRFFDALADLVIMFLESDELSPNG